MRLRQKGAVLLVLVIGL